MSKNLRLPISDLTTGLLTLSADAARYVTRVHRLRIGDHLVMFDPARGLEADARLVSTQPSTDCQVGELRAGTRNGFPGLRLLQCLGKGDKAEQVVRDATALGAGRILLVESGRSVSRLTDKAKAAQKRTRYENVAREAARQCLRSDVPLIEPLIHLRDYVPTIASSVHWVLHPGAKISVSRALAEFQGGECTLCIGPEGGFSADELSALVSAGAQLLHLGPLVLRTETAATVALALISARLRDNT